MSSPKSPDPQNPLPDSMRTRKPWPMWPIALSIVLFTGVYTWINIEYRKNEKVFEPFQAMMDRKNAIVQKNFYDWYSIKATRAEQPITISSLAASSTRSYEGVLDAVIPEQLKYYMASRPVLVPGFIKTESPDNLTPGQLLPIRLYVPSSLSKDGRLRLLCFYKDGELFLLASLYVENMEDFDQRLLLGEAEPVDFLVPTEPIAAETIQVRFLTEGRLAEWQIKNLDPSLAVIQKENSPIL